MLPLHSMGFKEADGNNVGQRKGTDAELQRVYNRIGGWKIWEVVPLTCKGAILEASDSAQ